MHFAPGGGEDFELRRLEDFTATTAAPGHRHWELVAEKLVQALAYGWPHDHKVMLGWDASQLAAVAYWFHVDHYIYLQVVAVAASHQGRRVGGDLMEHVLATIDEASDCTVITRVHELNEVSLAMMRRCGFTIESRQGEYMQLVR